MMHRLRKVLVAFAAPAAAVLTVTVLLMGVSLSSAVAFDVSPSPAGHSYNVEVDGNAGCWRFDTNGDFWWNGLLGSWWRLPSLHPGIARWQAFLDWSSPACGLTTYDFFGTTNVQGDLSATGLEVADLCFVYQIIRAQGQVVPSGC